jgi:outer membrane protein TolC
MFSRMKSILHSAVVLGVALLMSGAGVLMALAPPAHAQPRAAAADTAEVSLSSSIRRALEVSPEVDQRRAQRAFAEARHDEARANRFFTDFTGSSAHSLAPGLDIPSGVTRPNDELYLEPDVTNDWENLRLFTRVQAELTQPIYTWGQLSSTIRAAEHGIDVEEAAVENKSLEVAARTGELYFSLLLTNALDRLARETGDAINRAQREVERLLDEGAEDVDQADLFKVQLTKQEYNRRVVEINQRQQTARAALKRQLFLPERTTLQLADRELAPLPFEVPSDSLAHFMQLAVNNRPELEQVRAGIAARSALVDVAQSDYYPKLFFGTSASFTYTPGRYRQPNPYVGDPFRSRSARTGFGLRMNLNFYQTRARVEQARAELNEVRYQQSAAEQLVRFEVEDAYRNVLIAQADVESRDESVTITEEWLRTEQINFDLDIGNTENLIDAVRANLEAEASYYQAVQRYNVAILKLLRATGTLTSRIDTGTLID